MSTSGESASPARGRGHLLSELAGTFGLAVSPTGSQDLGAAVAGLSLDNRTIATGEVFAALPGAKAHGAAFARAAVDAGAVAVLTDPDGVELVGPVSVPILVSEDPRGLLGNLAAWVQDAPATRLRTFGITGTNGKTTTSYLLEYALAALGSTTGMIGTVELKVGDHRSPAHLTTPEAPELHALLARMVLSGVRDLVMEVSSHALALHRVDGIVFDLVAFTNLTQDHLDFHGTLEDYFATKAQLFTPRWARRGVVVVDDAWGQLLAREATIDVVTLGTHLRGPDADWQVSTTGTRGDHTDFTITHRDGRSLSTTIWLPGHFNVANAALALVMAIEAGAELPVLRRELGDGLRPVVPGRMELVAPAPRCLVDFAHNAEALELALAALRPWTKGRLFVVFGATGERDRGKREAMGRVAVEGADVVVITDDDPHDEDPATIRAEVMSGALGALGRAQRAGRTVDLFDVSPRQAAIRRAVSFAGPADTVLVAGRGHETWQEIAGVNHHLDDREEVRAAMSQRTRTVGVDG
ncbi:MAG: UDP-N-acetylmuramoyl-L-alanyl-D-glutamate--2,6-diaminopimelate ligase [Actinomycetales bacterium]|nr:UDP-N-acetylmuramoyl-L-alanyl-D-glutamate--2,6-diaminopimelate ligase [Actinomycetales bacterium]